MARVRGWRWVMGTIAVCMYMAGISRAQVTFTTLVYLGGNGSGNPYLMALIQGSDGNLYGTTEFGGANETCDPFCGMAFKMTPAGELTTLYSFCSKPGCTDGYYPAGSLVQGSDGNFYGTTTSGGANFACSPSCGTVFKMTPAGELTTLHSFCSLANCSDGYLPLAGLVQATNGKFYGTTKWGGSAPYNAGTVFEITAAGKLTTLHSFCSSAKCSDGSEPESPLIQGRDGNLYGETSGTIFKIALGGKLTTLVTFRGANGSFPIGGLMQAANGEFYGTASAGGAYDSGTVFKMTPRGELTTLYNFCSSQSVPCPDGAGPYGPLTQGTDGNFYGTTSIGGTKDCVAGCGTVFEITPAGSLTTLYTLCYFCGSGAEPTAGLLQATNGAFYGTTSASGGTIFTLTDGLGPFVKTQPTFAKQGSTVGIFGQGFTSSSIVQFGGVQASNIKVLGASFLFATVPAGALTGSVTVTTGATTLTSNQPFRVKPQVLSFNPPSGSVGTQVTITGTGFTQTNGVGFGDNVPAQFTVNSDKQVTATVPAGAQTGPIGVVTKGGTAVSSATFTVD